MNVGVDADAGVEHLIIPHTETPNPRVALKYQGSRQQSKIAAYVQLYFVEHTRMRGAAGGTYHGVCFGRPAACKERQPSALGVQITCESCFRRGVDERQRPALLFWTKKIVHNVGECKRMPHQVAWRARKVIPTAYYYRHENTTWRCEGSQVFCIHPFWSSAFPTTKHYCSISYRGRAFFVVRTNNNPFGAAHSSEGFSSPPPPQPMGLPRSFPPPPHLPLPSSGRKTHGQLFASVKLLCTEPPCQ